MSVAEPPLITRTEPVPSWIVPVKVVAFDPSSRSVPAVVEVFVTTPADPAKAATLTEPPLRSTLPASLRVRLIEAGWAAAPLNWTAPDCTANEPLIRLVPLNSKVPGPNLVKLFAVTEPDRVGKVPPVKPVLV